MHSQTHLSPNEQLAATDTPHPLLPQNSIHFLQTLYLDEDDHQHPQHLELFEALLREKDSEHLTTEDNISCPVGVSGQVAPGHPEMLSEMKRTMAHAKQFKVKKIRKGSQLVQREKVREVKPRRGSLKAHNAVKDKSQQSLGIQQNICSACSFQNQKLMQGLPPLVLHSEDTEGSSLFSSQAQAETSGDLELPAREYILDFESYLTLD